MPVNAFVLVGVPDAVQMYSVALAAGLRDTTPQNSLTSAQRRPSK